MVGVGGLRYGVEAGKAVNEVGCRGGVKNEGVGWIVGED